MTFGVRRRLAAALLFAAACRTAHVSGPAVAPLPQAQTESPLESLFARADAFPGARSILRIRVTNGGETKSFRAQLIVENRQQMKLIVYSPVGTTVATVTTEGEHVSLVDSVHGNTIEGNAQQMLAPYGFFTGGLTPAEMGMLLLGYPPRRDLTYETTTAGLSRALFGDIVVSFDPPAFPAQHAVIEHGTDRVEIDHLEIAAMH